MVKQDPKHIPSSTEDPLYVRKEKSIRALIKDGVFTSTKNGFTESFIAPFAIALNANTWILSALVSVPQLVASFFQLFSEQALPLFKTRKRLIVITAFLQALMWLPLLFIPFLAPNAAWLILLLVVFETTIGHFQGPVFNSILGDSVDEGKRGEFFGKRNAIVNLVGFISTLIAGLILNAFKNAGASYVFYGFAILFFIAFVSRSIAAYFKTKVYDPPYTPAKNPVTFGYFLKNMTNNNYGIFVMYVFFFRIAAFVSAPFFALYLLQDLHLTYIQFTLILAVSIIAGFLSTKFCGYMIDRHGSKQVLAISGFLIPLSPLLLILAIYIKDPLYLMIFLILEEAFSGVVWAAFNLSTSTFIFDATSKEERIRYIAYGQFLYGIAIFLGATLGGFLFTIYPIWIVSAIPLIFLTTGLLRIFVTVVLIGKVHEARLVEVPLPGRQFFHRFISISPHGWNNIEIIGVEHHKPVSRPVAPSAKKTIDPVRKDERKLYEKKSLDYYRENAMKTLNQKQKEYTPKDDSDKIEKDLETHTKDISELTEKIQKDRVKKR